MVRSSHFYVAGVRIDAVRVQDTIDRMHLWIQEGRKEYVVLTGAHGVVEMQNDPELLRINNAAGLTTPDGMPIVWLGRVAGCAEIEKVYGPEIMLAEFSVSAARGHRHFFYGGREGVADKLKRVLEQRFHGIEIVGTYCPPFRPLTKFEVGDVAATINASGASIVWCGLGCPKQERWMAQFRPLLEAPVLIGVGAGFDFIAGEKPIAPRWVQRSGFEWLFRMAIEPNRLWPRYSRVVPRFIYYVARDSIRHALS